MPKVPPFPDNDFESLAQVEKSVWAKKDFSVFLSLNMYKFCLEPDQPNITLQKKHVFKQFYPDIIW